MIPYATRFSNFRSIGTEPVDLPFSKKITLLVGPNNVGKSNILRALSIVANKANSALQARDFGEGRQEQINFSFHLSSEAIARKIVNLRLARHRYAGSSIDVAYAVHRGGIDLVESSETFQALSVAFPRYFNTHDFLEDFHQAGEPAVNMTQFLKRLSILDDFKGTTYLPHLRFVSNLNQEPPYFLQDKFAGDTIAFGSVISRLAEMDRPNPTQLHFKKQLEAIEAFLCHCLESTPIHIEVASDKTAILVRVGNEVRSLASLGTGVEQLLMIGLASMGFTNRLVLIDEPELHLHPRAQKRMLQYLNDNANARFVIATHSAAVLDAVDADIVHVTQLEGKSVARTIASNAERYKAVRTLGHSPSELVQTRFAVWVEGPSDRIYINHWIERLGPELIEGIDYTILFYGGSILSQHSFTDEIPMAEPELVKALSMSRSFAVIMDSDQSKEKPDLRDTKIRVRSEVAQNNGFCWITDGREIENYISSAVLSKLAEEFSYVTQVQDKYQQVLDPSRAIKVVVARRAIELDDGSWPLDLEKQMSELVRRIKAAT